MSHDFGDRLAHCRGIVLNLEKSAKRVEPWVRESLAELDHYLSSLFKEYNSKGGRLK